MNEPAYQLRPNKAVDRFIFIEAIRRLESVANLSEYTYFGMGGPYLEDFRVLYEVCQDIGMVSIEKDEQVYKRQEFHRPCRPLILRRMDVFDFVDQYDSEGKKSIFWLDFTGLEYRHFECFIQLLPKLEEGSVLKITLRAHAKDYFQRTGEFLDKFEALMPHSISEIPERNEDFGKLVHDMLRVAVQRALEGLSDIVFQPITSFFYSDGSYMLTFTGILCSNETSSQFQNAFEGLEFANLGWGDPQRIDVPTLSTKERLHLQGKLPPNNPAGDVLMKTLGYLLGTNKSATKRKLEQYSTFHRHYPYFMRSVP